MAGFIGLTTPVFELPWTGPTLIAAACVETPDEVLADHAKRLEFQTEALQRLVTEELNVKAIRYVSEADELKTETAESPAPVAEAKVAKEAPKAAHTTAELMEAITGTAVDSPLCFTCGTKMRPAGSCYVCEGCGSTSGCS